MITKWNLWTAVAAVILLLSQIYSPQLIASTKDQFLKDHSLKDQPLSADPFVRVRLMSLQHKIKLSGMAVSIQGRRAKFSPVSLPREREFDVSFEKLGSKTVWKVKSENGSIKQVKGNPLALEGDFLRVGRQLTPSRLLLFARPEQTVDVIAVIDIEQYLLGVLAGEMPASWPIEALKAQAVASRSYALFNRQQKNRRRFHLESTIHDQVFDFQGSRLLSKSLKEKIRRAVDETRGQVLFTQKNQVLQSFYHADCGGQTAPTQEIWGDRNLISSVKDPFCPSTPYRSWSYRLRKKDFLKRLGFSGQSLKKIEVLNLTSSQRVDQVGLFFGQSKTKKVSAHQMRHQLGTSKVKSTRFNISLQGSWVELRGSGYGHGVGLCQWGSRSRAIAGQSYEAILSHYYPTAKLIRVYEPGSDPDLRMAEDSSYRLFSKAPKSADKRELGI